MSDRTLRTIGATLILAGIVVAAVVQIRKSDSATPAVEIETAAPSVDVSAPASTTPSAVAPSEPFVYRIGVLSGISTDNYWAFYGDQPSVWNSYILGPTKPTLYTIDQATGTVETELATALTTPSWDGDGWTVEVQLDPAFHWSDGEAVTAHDFVFTFQTATSFGLQGSWAEAFGSGIESVHADGDHKIRIDFGERPTLSVWPHGAGLAPIMPAHVWEEIVDGATAEELYAADGSSDVSGGPLDIVEVSDDLVVSKANPGYTAGHAPERVEYRVYDSEAAMLVAIDRGEIDTMLTPNGLTTDQMADVSNPNISFLSNPANAIRYLGFNLHRPPMSDEAFRQALALLVDRGDLAGAIADGEPAWSFVPPSNSQWFDDEVAERNSARFTRGIDERLADAIAGLRAAGYVWEVEPSFGADGLLVPGLGLTIDSVAPQPLTLLTPGDAYDPARLTSVQAIADALGVLGFDARPVETDFDTVIDLAFSPGEDGVLHYDMYVLGWTLGSPALPSYYGPLFSEHGAMNNTGYASDMFSAAWDDYEGAYTVAEAKVALRSMEEVLAQDLPYLLLYTTNLTEAYRADRVGFDFGESLGGLQARLGAITDVHPAG